MATNNNNMLTVVQQVDDMVAKYGYRSTDYGFIAGGSAGNVHFIFGSVSPVGLLANVPNGSVFINVATKIIYVKYVSTAPQGVGSGFDGVWTAVTGS